MMNGAVMLPEFAAVSPAKTAANAKAGRQSREEMRKVCFAMSLAAGAGPDKTEETRHLSGDELKIGRAGQRDERQQKDENIGGPEAPLRPATGFGAERLAPAQPGVAQFVEAGFGDAEQSGRQGRGEAPVIEFGENAADKLGQESVEKLHFFHPRKLRCWPPESEE